MLTAPRCLVAQGLSQYPTAVLRVLSESAALRHLPASTIMYEEYTRADLQLLLLSGVVEVRVLLRAAAAHLCFRALQGTGVWGWNLHFVRLRRQLANCRLSDCEGPGCSCSSPAEAVDRERGRAGHGAQDCSRARDRAGGHAHGAGGVA